MSENRCLKNDVIERKVTFALLRFVLGLFEDGNT